MLNKFKKILIGVILAVVLAASLPAGAPIVSKEEAIFMPYGSWSSDEQDLDARGPKEMTVRAVVLGSPGNSTGRLDERGNLIFHIDGDFDVGVYSVSKRISIAEENKTRFPRGIDYSGGEFDVAVRLSPALMNRIGSAERKNLEVKIFRNGSELVGARKLGFREKTAVAIGSATISGKDVRIVLAGERDYAYQNPIAVWISDDNGNLVDKGYLVQPKFDAQGMYVNPLIKLEKEPTRNLRAVMVVMDDRRIVRSEERYVERQKQTEEQKQIREPISEQKQNRTHQVVRSTGR